MKAFKIINISSEFNLCFGFVVAEDADKACEFWEKHCIKNDTYDYFEDSELREVTREEFCAIMLIDETAEPNEDGEYPLSDMDYDEEVTNVTEPYVIEFDH